MILINYFLVACGVIGAVFAAFCVRLAYVELRVAPEGPLQLVGLRRLRQNYLVLIILMLKTVFGILTLIYSPFDPDTYEAADFVITMLLAVLATSNYIEIRYWPWEWKK